MRNIIICLLLIAVSAAVYSGEHKHGPGMHGGHEELEFLHNDMDSIMEEYADKQIGELTFSEIHDLQGRISVVQQKMMFVHKSKIASFIKPGMGQFINGENGSGALFLTADLAVLTGKLVGAYLLLPAELQFKELDYFNDSYAAIKAEWEMQSFMDLLPSVGVIVGASLVRIILRGISSKHAGKLAVDSILSDKRTFDVDISPMHFGNGMMGMGMQIKY
jgi:hypothetical protein